MPTHGHVAQKVRQDKEAHPERFCPRPGCLWKVATVRGVSPCRKHPPTPVEEDAFWKVAYALAEAEQEAAAHRRKELERRTRFYTSDGYGCVVADEDPRRW